MGGSSLQLKAEEAFQFASDDLLLAVQATGGTGANQNVFYNLGKTTDFLNGGNLGVLGNLSSVLATTYGSGWFERSDLWFGVAGNRDHLNPLFATPPEEGQEPSRIWYVSRAAATPGASLAWAPIGGSGLSSGGTNFFGVKRLFSDPTTGETLFATAENAAVLSSNEQPVGWNNSWSKWNPTPGAAFEIWTGGIQNNFGKGGSQVYVDVQRVAPNTAGVRVVTIAIGSDGSVTAIPSATEPGGSPFADWIAQFATQIPLEADRAPGADPDKDGFTNLQEFAFGGNPAVAGDNGQRYTRTVDATGNSLRDLTLTVEVRAGATFTVSGSAMVAVRDGVSYRIEGTTDLQNFNSPVSEVTPHLGTGSPKTGYEFKTFRLNASSGLTGQGFLRTTVEEG